MFGEGRRRQHRAVRSAAPSPGVSWTGQPAKVNPGVSSSAVNLHRSTAVNPSRSTRVQSPLSYHHPWSDKQSPLVQSPLVQEFPLVQESPLVLECPLEQSPLSSHHHDIAQIGANHGPGPSQVVPFFPPSKNQARKSEPVSTFEGGRESRNQRPTSCRLHPLLSA